MLVLLLVNLNTVPPPVPKLVPPPVPPPFPPLFTPVCGIYCRNIDCYRWQNLNALTCDDMKTLLSCDCTGCCIENLLPPPLSPPPLSPHPLSPPPLSPLQPSYKLLSSLSVKIIFLCSGMILITCIIFCSTICCLKRKFKHKKTIKPEESKNKNQRPLQPLTEQDIDQESQRRSSAPPAHPTQSTNTLPILSNKNIKQEQQQLPQLLPPELQQLPQLLPPQLLPPQLPPQLPCLQSQRVFMQTSLQQNLKPPLKSIVKTVTQNL